MLPIAPPPPPPQVASPALYELVSVRLALYATQQSKFDALYDELVVPSVARAATCAVAPDSLVATEVAPHIGRAADPRVKMVNYCAIRSHLPVELARRLRVAPCVKRKTTVFVAGRFSVRRRRPRTTSASVASQRSSKRTRSALECVAGGAEAEDGGELDALVDALWRRKQRAGPPPKRGVGRPRKKARRGLPVDAVFMRRNVRGSTGGGRGGEGDGGATALIATAPPQYPVALATPRPRALRPPARRASAVVADWLGNSRAAPAARLPSRLRVHDNAAGGAAARKPARRVVPSAVRPTARPLHPQALAAASPPSAGGGYDSLLQLATSARRAALRSAPSAAPVAARRGLGLQRAPRPVAARLPASPFPRLPVPPCAASGAPVGALGGAGQGLLSAAARPTVAVRPRPTTRPAPAQSPWWNPAD